MVEVYLVKRELLSGQGVEAMMRVIMKMKGYKEKIRFTYNEYNKPNLRDYPDIHFSGSHSGEYMICAISDLAVGIDIQILDMSKNGAALSKRFMSKEEHEEIVSMPLEDQMKVFYRIWTQNEAYMKYTGLGFGLPMNTFRPAKVGKNWKIINMGKMMDNIQLESLDVAENYEAWICGEMTSPVGEIIQITEMDINGK